MAATLARLVLKIGADVTGVTAGMNTLDKRTRKLKRQFGSVRDSTLSWQKSLGVLAGAAGLGLALKKINDVGSSVEETANKFNVVMGPAADAMRERIQKLTETVPLMQSEMEGMSAGVQDLLVPLGIARTEAAGMSVDMVALAGDLASFNDVAADVPLDAIKSGLAGQSRPLRQFGVDVSATRLKMLAMEEGLIGMGEEMTTAARAQAVMIAIQRDSSDAMGDAARTADSAANRMRFFIRDVKQLGESFAVALVPAIQVFVKEGGGGLQFLETFAAELKNQAPVIAAWAKFAVEAGKFVAKAFAAPLRIAFNLGQVIGDLGVAFVKLAQRDFAGAAEAGRRIKDNFGDMKDVVTGLVDSFEDMQFAAGDAFGTLPEKVETTTAALRTFGEEGEEAVNRITRGVKTLKESMSGLAAEADVFAAKFSTSIFQSRGLGLAGAGAAGGVFEGMLPGDRGGAGGIFAGRDLGGRTQQFNTAIQEGMDEASKKARETAMQVTNVFDRTFSSLIDGTTSFRDAFKQMSVGILKDLARMIARALFLRAILSALGGGAGPVSGAGGGGGAGFAGHFAHGGRIPSGQFGLVAEAGRPEVIARPSLVQGPAQVTPMGRGGGPSPAAVASEILAQMGPLPDKPLSPNEAYLHPWYRELFARAIVDFEERRS